MDNELLLFNFRLSSLSPLVSPKRPSSTSLEISCIVTGCSETVRLLGRPDNRLELEECSHARVSTESRVTPGRIMPSRGGVTISKPCG